MFIGELLFKLIVGFFKGMWRAIRVKRSSPEEPHSAAEYADAFLFRDNDQKPRN